MKTCSRWWSMRRGALAAVVGCLTLLVPGADVMAQEKSKDKESYQLRSVVRLGYTRPGSPDDKLNKDGTIRQLAWDDQHTGKMIGGTVYFMVLERTGTDGDTWGAGMAGIDSRFVAGRNRQGQYSPKLDRAAKYIYLYQLVNDRGMETPAVLPAGGNKDLNVVDIAGTALNLVVDPRYITSWGYFKGTGFVAMVPDKDAKGAVVAAADGKTSDIRLAVSSNRSILDALPEKMYKYKSPAYPLTDLADSFNIGVANFNLKASAQYKQVSNVATPVNYQANFLKAADNVKEPDYVSILYAGSRERPLAVVDPEEENPILAVFRADWKDAETLVKLGYHSVVYGFTSDLPPVDETIRIEDPEAARRLDAGRPQVDRPGRKGLQRSRPQAGQAATPAAAPGTAPSPTPPAGGVGVAGAGLLGGMMGAPAMGGGGMVPPLTPTVGFRPSAGAFGGFGGQQGEEQAAAQQGTVTVNFNPVLTNTQSQSQAQSQSQTQGQVQQQLPPPVKPPKPDHKPPTHCPKGEVIPEPAAIVLGLLGLPALYWIRRRRQAAALPA